MKYILIFVMMSCIVSIYAQTTDARETRERIQSLQQMIDVTNSGWRASETSMSRIPLIEFQQRLGLVIGENPGNETVEETVYDRETPAYVNWYEKGYITSIKDQGHCGSCYAFASCALLESYYLQKHNMSLDLSEQYFMMKTKVGSLFGGCKGNNLWVCAGACIAFGAPTEACCPYKAEESACPQTCDKNYRATCLVTGKVDGFQQVLSNHSPIVVGFMVFEDFRDYAGGVYKYVHGKFLGGHAVLIVGYNKEQKYWIVKNSWGNDWGEPCDGKTGERGYFRIGFEQCFIEMPYMGPFYTPIE